MALTERETEQMKETAELEVRRYFDNYLENVFPAQVRTFIQMHNLSPKAHGGVERRLSKLVWMVMGAGVAGGGTVAGVLKLIAMVGGGS